MKTLTRSKVKIILLNVSLTAFFFILNIANTVYADCGGNYVPNPLNVNCTPGQEVSAGGLLNRFLGIIPSAITIVAVVAIGRGGVKIMLADNGEKKQDGFKSVINAALGVAVFYSIWIILYVIEQATGADLLSFG